MKCAMVAVSLIYLRLVLVSCMAARIVLAGVGLRTSCPGTRMHSTQWQCNPLATDMYGCIWRSGTVGRAVSLGCGSVCGGCITVSRSSFAVTSFSNKGIVYLTSARLLNPAPQSVHKWGRSTLALIVGRALT